MRNFFTSASENWTNESGQLHVYALPDPTFPQAVQAFIDVLTTSDLCTVQPPGTFHMTIQRLPVFRDQIDDAAVAEFNTALAGLWDGLGTAAFHLRGPQVLDDAVVIRAPIDEQWQRLTQVTRQATEMVFGSGALHFDPPALGPHMTLAYGSRVGDAGPLSEQLAQVKTSTATDPSADVYLLAIASVHLVAVHQEPDIGAYTFDMIA